MSFPVKSPRKLIEVALPLDAISAEASLRKRKAPAGYPTALHKWWAQRPPAAARAVIFAQFINDPGYQQGGGFRFGKNKKEAAIERKRLFKIIEDLVLWENTNNEEMLARVRAEIRRSWREVCELNKDHPQATVLFDPERLPALHDPFGGGGTIPLEAQRLGLQVYASDLNPVAVLINKAMIEIPPRFTARSPVSLSARAAQGEKKDLGFNQSWHGATGLAEDVRYYGTKMYEEAQKRIGHLYPEIDVTADMAKNLPKLRTLVGKKLTVVAWLWARTVRCPNPACNCEMPLLSSFVLSSKEGMEVYLNPKIDDERMTFGVQQEPPSGMPEPTKGYKKGKSAVFECAFCHTITDRSYIAHQALERGLGAVQTAVIAEGKGGRVYLPAEISPIPIDIPSVDVRGLDIELAPNPRDVWCRNFGLLRPMDLFTPRQLVAMITLSDLVKEVRELVKRDAVAAGMSDDNQGLDSGGTAATAYAEAVCVYLALAQSRAQDYGCSLATWRPKDNAMRSGMAKQTLPMTWDFAEGNPFGELSAGFFECVEVIAKVISTSLGPSSGSIGSAVQRNAAYGKLDLELPIAVVNTDPPYYNNIGYADLSDFFYVWLRRSLRPTYPGLFSTIAAPKVDELVAAPFRQGGKEAAEQFFLEGMTRAISNLASESHPAFPLTIYYAFKQSETKADGTSSTGWDTFLAAVIRAGLAITGTWPVRTEGDNRQVGVGNNALASSIVLVCRNRPADAPTISRREFIRELNGVLPEALDEMTKGAGGDHSPVAPVDLSQAIIGPGMAVFSKYAAVLEADGSPMCVKTALQLINRFLAEDDFDADTQFCLHWFEQHGWTESVFGEADVLARSKSTSVDAMKEAGVLHSGGGKVRLLKWSEYPTNWDPRTDTRTPVWEALHQLIRALKQGGESASGALLAALGGKAEAARQLAYRLYTLCERLGQAEDARAYNELITSWTGIESAATNLPESAERQGVLI